MEDMYYNYPVNLPDVSRTQSVVHIRHPHKIRDEDGRSRREYPRQQKQDMRFARSSSVRPSRLRTGRTLRRLFPAGRCPRLIFTAR